MKVLYGDVRVRDRVRDRDLLLTYMYTLNFLNNYFIAILTAAVSFTLVLSHCHCSFTAGSAAAV
jgi:hypothetical protein